MIKSKNSTKCDRIKITDINNLLFQSENAMNVLNGIKRVIKVDQARVQVSANEEHFVLIDDPNELGEVLYIKVIPFHQPNIRVFYLGYHKRLQMLIITEHFLQ